MFSTHVVVYLAAIATILSLFVAIVALVRNEPNDQPEKKKTVDIESVAPVFKEEQRLLEGVYEHHE